MFNNIGKKIKTLVKAVFGLIAGLAIGAVISTFFIGVFIGRETWTFFFISLVAAVVVIFLGWIGSFVLYGFGELVENSEETKKYTKAIYDELTAKKANNGVDDSTSNNTIPAWTCQNCKEDNPDTSVFCQNCGTHR